MSPSLSPAIVALLQARWRIAAAMVGLTILSVLLTLLLPNTYEATVTILPAPLTANNSVLMMQSPLLNDLQQLASSAGTETGFGAQSLTNIHLALLKSRTLQDRIIAKFTLATVYDTRSDDETRDEFARHLAISTTQEDTIMVKVRDHDAARAAAIANAVGTELATMTKTFTMTTAKRNRMFLEEQLREADNSLRAAEEALTRFQQEYNLVALDEQVKAAVEADAALQASLTSAQVELQVALQTYGPAHPEVVRLRTHIDELSAQIRSAQHASYGRPTLSGMAKHGQRLATLIRDVRTQEAIHFLILQQYEQARLAESQQGDLLQILDDAVTPSDPVFPKLWLVMVVSLFLGLLLTIAWILLDDWRRRLLPDLPPALPLWGTGS
jgi:uncharacterized protein involved in exopolysaccharide biosynthesis